MKPFTKIIFYLLLVISCTKENEGDVFDDINQDQAGEELIINSEDFGNEIMNQYLKNFSLVSVSDQTRESENNRLSKRNLIISTFKSDEDCDHEISETLENKNFNVGSSLTEQDIQNFINAPVVSYTDFSLRYFNIDGSPSTNCETEEIEFEHPDHGDKDLLQRPKWYSYSNIFDYTGSRSFEKKFYLEDEEVTYYYPNNPISHFKRTGTVIKKVEWSHQVHISTTATHKRIENLDLSGFYKDDLTFIWGRDRKKYFFHRTFTFLPTSKSYREIAYNIKYDKDANNPSPGDTSFDVVDDYSLQFSVKINFPDSGNRTAAVPFFFDISISAEDIADSFKDNDFYEKTISIYFENGHDSKKRCGTLTYKLDDEGNETWTSDMPDTLDASSSEVTYLINTYGH